MPRSRTFRPFPGVLALENVSGDVVDVFYVPSKERLNESGIDDLLCDPELYRVKLLQLDNCIGSLTMFPIQTSGRNSEFLEPLYSRIRSIAIHSPRLIEVNFTQYPLSCQDDVMSLLDRLPNCFVKGYDYGLGFRQDFYSIVETVQVISPCSEVQISDALVTQADASNGVFRIAYRDFQAMLKAIRKSMKNSTSHGRAYNVEMLSSFLSDRLADSPATRRPGSRLVRLYPLPENRHSMAAQDSNQALSLVAENVRSIATSQPDKFDDFSRAFDLARLDALIEEYERMMNRRSQESEWQRFFERYQLLLSQAMGYPIVFVLGQPAVGGGKLDGSGGKYGDFLYKNSQTNNSVLVELKTPRTKLLNAKPVRAGMYGPSSELSGSLTQVLDQRNFFQKSISAFKDNSRIHDIESYAVRGCLVIGILPDDEDMKKSFELYRGNSKDVDIVTFDELLERIKQFKEFLTMLDDEG